nr:PREDICTED: uncharacterized protein LOC105674603 [Linepithema humile]XP_012226482.1 PREDICTED: uncharacterized protein LOC105674603 [Linepithema humile]
MDFFKVIRDRNETVHFGEAQTTHMQYDTYEYSEETTSEDIPNWPLTKKSTLVDTESPYEEPYDYEKFKMEYEQQLDYDIRHGKALNYTEKEDLEDTPKKTLERIIDLKRPKNCTKEELSQIGIKAIECLIYDYRRTKDVATMKKVLSRTWLVLRVWLLIYFCLAIPCWCQRGWCCCCFRCKFCFPRERILSAKQYYTMNPPGIFVKDLKKEEDVREPIKYEATEYERHAYETFEAAIMNV